MCAVQKLRTHSPERWIELSWQLLCEYITFNGSVVSRTRFTAEIGVVVAVHWRHCAAEVCSVTERTRSSVAGWTGRFLGALSTRAAALLSLIIHGAVEVCVRLTPRHVVPVFTACNVTSTCYLSRRTLRYLLVSVILRLSEKVNVENELLQQVKRRKLTYYGHIIRKTDCLEKDLILDWRMHARIQNKGSSKKTLERRYQRVDWAIHQCGSKICRGQKTVEGRYACCPPFNWKMELDDDDDDYVTAVWAERSEWKHRAVVVDVSWNRQCCYQGLKVPGQKQGQGLVLLRTRTFLDDNNTGNRLRKKEMNIMEKKLFTCY